MFGLYKKIEIFSSVEQSSSKENNTP